MHWTSQIHYKGTVNILVLVIIPSILTQKIEVSVMGNVKDAEKVYQQCFIRCNQILNAIINITQNWF